MSYTPKKSKKGKGIKGKSLASILKSFKYTEKPDILWGAENVDSKRPDKYGPKLSNRGGEGCDYENPFQVCGPGDGDQQGGTDTGTSHGTDDGGWDEWDEWRKCIAAGGGGDCYQPEQEPEFTLCQPWPSCAEEERTPQPDPPRPFNFNLTKPTLRGGPEGPEGPTVDLFDPWKYRGITNEYSLNYKHQF